MPVVVGVWEKSPLSMKEPSFKRTGSLNMVQAVSDD